MKYFWSLAPISGVGIYATLDLDTSMLSVMQSNSDRILQSWDTVTSPNSAVLYDWAMANGALPIAQCVDLEEARGVREPVYASADNPEGSGDLIPEVDTVKVDELVEPVASACVWTPKTVPETPTEAPVATITVVEPVKEATEGGGNDGAGGETEGGAGA